ncbi:hypothetical protein RB195_024934 [Necator americanus]|uniref:Reverse transcriptase domain-containing protein n=1 Tax=Necator americanus TaxID=51031 RepID=A0ABR1EQ84_NECAM
MRRTVDQCPADIVLAPSRCPLTDLEYADDVVIFAESSTKLQHVVNLVSKLAAAYGLRLRPDKCKQMWISSRPRTGIRVDGQPMELVDEFCYLGSTLKNKGSFERDVQQRCAKATSAFNSLTKCLWSTPITNEVKLRVYLSAIRPIMMYGSETWAAPSTVMERLDCTGRKLLRRLLGYFWPRVCHNEDLNAEIDVIYRRMTRGRHQHLAPPSKVAKVNSLRFIGHILRRTADPKLSQKIEKVEHSCFQGRHTSAKMRVIASDDDIIPPNKSSKEPIKEDLKGRRASVSAEAAEAGKSIRHARRVIHLQDEDDCSPDPNSSRTAITSRSGVEKIIYDFSHLFGTHVNLPSHHLKEDRRNRFRDSASAPQIFQSEHLKTLQPVLINSGGALHTLPIGIQGSLTLEYEQNRVVA